MVRVLLQGLQVQNGSWLLDSCRSCCLEGLLSVNWKSPYVLFLRLLWDRGSNGDHPHPQCIPSNTSVLEMGVLVSFIVIEGAIKDPQKWVEFQWLLESGWPLHLHSGCGSDFIVLNSPRLCPCIPSTDFLKPCGDRMPKLFMFPDSWGIAYTPSSPLLSWDWFTVDRRVSCHMRVVPCSHHSSVSESLCSALFGLYTPFSHKTLATIDFYFHC